MQIAERGGAGGTFQPTVSDQLPHHCAILLLNPSLVVLFVSPRPGHLDAAFTAVGKHGFVDEGAIVIHVQPEYGKGKLAADFIDRQGYKRLFAHHHGGCFCPAGRDIGQN